MQTRPTRFYLGLCRLFYVFMITEKLILGYMDCMQGSPLAMLLFIVSGLKVPFILRYYILSGIELSSTVKKTKSSANAHIIKIKRVLTFCQRINDKPTRAKRGRSNTNSAVPSRGTRDERAAPRGGQKSPPPEAHVSISNHITFPLKSPPRI